MSIPKLLHFIWVGKPMPDHLRDNVYRWRDMHPDWECRVWAEDQLQWLKSWALFDAAETLVVPDAVGQFKADIARYEILHRYGGFYADVDTYPLRRIDEALEGHDVFAAAEDSQWVGNTYLGAVPEHPVFAELVNSISNSVQKNPGARPCVSTGPQYLTPIWKRAKAYVAPTRDWFPYSWSDVRKGTVPMFIEEGPYAVHAWEHARTLARKKGRK